jgi:pimeloyl-ACP methyl ester carboxylesterase
MQVVVDGLMTDYVRAGKGKTVLMLHGWGDRKETFAALTKILMTNYDVIALDLPGFGKTDQPKSAWDTEDYASFISHFLTKIAAGDPYAVIGHSSGGAIAMRGIALKLFNAKKLVLLASAGVRGEYKGRAKALRIVTKTGKALTTPLPKSLKKKLQRKVYDTIGSDMLVAEHMQETFKKIIADDLRASAPQVASETLLIYGEKDTATPVQYGEMFHNLIHGSKLVVIPGASHFVHHDNPHEVETFVTEFLK